MCEGSDDYQRPAIKVAWAVECFLVIMWIELLFIHATAAYKNTKKFSAPVGEYNLSLRQEALIVHCQSHSLRPPLDLLP